MKNILFFVLVASAIAGCGECDNSNYFQIKAKDAVKTPSMCRFQATGLGPCSAWQTTQDIYFTDSCRFYQLSQILKRDVVFSLQNKSAAASAPN